MTSIDGWYAQDTRAWTCEAPDGAAASFHRQLPGYAPTPLAELPALAAELGVDRLFAKDESARFDLGAFKFLGASWAGFRAVAARSGYGGPAGLDGLRAHLLTRAGAAAAGGLALVTATDGNHGRAVARTARLLGLPARVYVPKSVPGAVIDRISGEGAQVTLTDEEYDGTVAAARADAAADGGAVLVQDTAWPGYEEVPGWIVDGYETLFAELDAQLAAAGAPVPALVSVPVGVGSLAQAAVAHYRRPALPAAGRPRLLSAEPATAACVLASLCAGSLVSVPTAGTVMNGLNCGTPSSLAWPYLRGGMDAAIAVDDTAVAPAMASLAAAGVMTGPSGAAAFAALRAALTGEGAPARRRDLRLDDPGGPAVVCLCTEGPLSA
jgi:diaminopropionate ammonia-lyase